MRPTAGQVPSGLAGRPGRVLCDGHPCSDTLTTLEGERRADALIAAVPPRAWYAHITLSMLALAWLAASRAQAEKGRSAPATLARLPRREASVHAIIARAVLHHITNLHAAPARLAAALWPGGILAIRDGIPLDQARFETMNRQLTAAGRPAEPRNGLDPGLLSQALNALGLHTRGPLIVGTGTFATPPWVPEIYESETFALHALKPSARP